MATTNCKKTIEDPRFWGQNSQMTLQQLPRPRNNLTQTVFLDKHFRIGEKSSIETKLKP